MNELNKKTENLLLLSQLCCERIFKRVFTYVRNMLTIFQVHSQFSKCKPVRRVTYNMRKCVCFGCHFKPKWPVFETGIDRSQTVESQWILSVDRIPKYQSLTIYLIPREAKIRNKKYFPSTSLPLLTRVYPGLILKGGKMKKKKSEEAKSHFSPKNTKFFHKLIFAFSYKFFPH